MTKTEVTSQAAALLEAISAQSAWTYGCLTMPGEYSEAARWTANEALSNVRSSPDTGWQDGYREAARRLRDELEKDA